MAFLLLLALLGFSGAVPDQRTASKEGFTVSGTVRDASGAVVPGAEITLRDAQQTILGVVRTDSQGQFRFPNVPRGSYLLVIVSPGFAERRLPVNVRRPPAEPLEVLIEPQPVREQLTVTASPGLVEPSDGVSQQVNLINEAGIEERAKTVLAQVANEEAGVHLQRTSPMLGGVFVRGLTGNKVPVFVDGVRYSTSTARGGINTFLDLIEPTALQGVEILRGPSSAQYGSDAIGGSVHFLSRVPSFSPTQARLRGRFGSFFNSADAGFGSNLEAGYAARNFGVLLTSAGRRVSTLRTGGGFDSHAAVTRFLGLRSDLFSGSRLPDTAFTHYSGALKINWSPSPGSQFIAYFNRSQQDGGKRYDQLLGGDGNLIAELRNLMLDFTYFRYNKLGWGPLNHFTAVYSYKAQREERVNQGGNGDPRAAVVHDRERTAVHGLQAFAGKRWDRHDLLLGGEYFHERLRAPSFTFQPPTGQTTLTRPRVPDRARYQSGAAYAQEIVELIPNRLRLAGNLRYAAASYRARAADSPVVSGGRLWPDDSLFASDVTFRTGLTLNLFQGLAAALNFSRGFRAPHMTDLGTLGLTGSGFEVAAPDVSRLRGSIGSTANRDAVSTGLAVRQVSPESSFTYELAVRYRSQRMDSNSVVFMNDMSDVITKQALILPPGAVGTQLGGETILQQDPNGVVFVAASSSPVLVRANYGEARIRGFEQKLDLRLPANWFLGTTLTYLHARDKRTGLPPNIEGGTPAPDAHLRLRYAPVGRRFWVEPYVHAAWAQNRLSTLDLGDRRTGAARSRGNIRNFFFNGATARGWVQAGPDGRLGSADDTLGASGETLAQIQDRVLGPGVAAAPLFSAIPGYLTCNVRGGFRFGERHQLSVDLENLTDRNYRGISWGLDAPGRGFFVRYALTFE